MLTLLVRPIKTRRFVGDGHLRNGYERKFANSIDEHGLVYIDVKTTEGDKRYLKQKMIWKVTHI